MIELGYEIRDRIARITLNRPDAKNAVTPAMHEEFCRIWANFAANDEADVAILTGVGEIVDVGDGGITRLVNTCGVGVAMQMVLTAEPIDAPRALHATW